MESTPTSDHQFTLVLYHSTFSSTCYTLGAICRIQLTYNPAHVWNQVRIEPGSWPLRGNRSAILLLRRLCLMVLKPFHTKDFLLKTKQSNSLMKYATRTFQTRESKLIWLNSWFRDEIEKSTSTIICIVIKWINSIVHVIHYMRILLVNVLTVCL